MQIYVLLVVLLAGSAEQAALVIYAAALVATQHLEEAVLIQLSLRIRRRQSPLMSSTNIHHTQTNSFMAISSTLAAFLFSSHPKKGKGSRGSLK